MVKLISFEAAYVKGMRRTYAPSEFFIRDLFGRPVKVASMGKVPIINHAKKTDKYWAIKRYRMGVCFLIKAVYKSDLNTNDFFLFHFWLKDMPLPFSHYDITRARMAYYTIFMFNIQHPEMYGFEIFESKIVITDKPYLVNFTDVSLADIERETNYDISRKYSRLI